MLACDFETGIGVWMGGGSGKGGGKGGECCVRWTPPVSKLHLLQGFSFIGYDGPAHMAEETVDAANAAPRSILVGFFFMMIVGWLWLVSLLFCITVGLGFRV